MGQHVANTTFSVGRRMVPKGTIVDADDPILAGREGLFRPVEQATVRPGEVSTAKRTTSKAAPPPKAGAGSSADAWRSYAATFDDVDVPDDAGRDDIIALLDQAGKPVDQDGD